MKLTHAETGEVRPLLARSLVGRSPACNVRLASSSVSGEHALVVWTGMAWEVRDLGSTNGTFIDGQRLESGRAVSLSARALVGFGEPAPGWWVPGHTAPGLVAIDLGSGKAALAESAILALPDEERPSLVVFEAGESGWVAEDVETAARQPVHDQSMLQVGGRVFRLELPTIHEGTPLAAGGDASLARSPLRFEVSTDEETVRIWVTIRGRTVALDPREHGYLLLVLARRRLADASKDPAERGWIDRDQLMRMLRIDNNRLNVAIYRARQQLADAGVQDAADIVEVRRGQRRIGTDRVTIDTAQ